jgi:cytochrome b561
MVAWKNSTIHFGAISRILHWGMAALILWQLILGTMIANIAPSLANLWLFGLHKTIGIIALALVLGRIVWHRFSPPPELPPEWPNGPARILGGARRKSIAKTAHRLLYACMIAMPLTGWVASSATGLDVVIFDTITLPAIAPLSEQWEKMFFFLHNGIGKGLMLLLLLHILGAVTQHKGVLARMMWG